MATAAHIRRSGCLALILGMMAVAVPHGMEGQGRSSESASPPPSARAATPADLVLAEALLQEARLYEASPDRSGWLQAAELHTRSAALRPLGDEEVFRSLFRAAQILHVMGQHEQAQRTLESSAEHARLYGHIGKEAEALMGAAWLANVRGDTATVNRHLSRAFLLTYSPLLPEATRAEVRRRVLLPALMRTAVTIAAI